MHTLFDLYPVVLLDAQLVHIITVVENGECESSRLIRSLLCHNLDVSHFPKLLDHNQDVFLGGVWRDTTEKHLFRSLVGLWVLVLTRDSSLAFNLIYTRQVGGDNKNVNMNGASF